MAFYQETLTLNSRRAGTHEFTDSVAQVVTRSGFDRGLVSVFCQHTSCSLVIMENADPTARRDLEAWMNRLVPDDDPEFEHTLEGPDDMPSHIKMALTRTSETVPFMNGQLQLGTWQGLFLWEHRVAPTTRRVVVTVMGEARQT
ncbi:MAG TPA: secondary thiamine-phosphate synthase enzyme YjbQ [Opitutaceae bacterium]|nr:secondary thiamine-phosphate synthase enzyme YjbQ [Opitutaceae bacterium]